jgi:hypothetical protein
MVLDEKHGERCLGLRAGLRPRRSALLRQLIQGLSGQTV